MLVGQIARGTASAQQLLRMSRLTPLAKPDNRGVRPIAVGKLLYRLCAKVLLRHYFKPDFLLPCQLGVGFMGGVEPVVRVVERALDQTLPQSYTHLVSLDFANTFNTVSRADLAAGLTDYAPALYRAGRWIYGQPTPLAVTGADGQLELIPSAQGVRQGDPFGPLFFSLAARQVVDHLVTRLGPSRILASYLNHMYVLSSDDHMLDDVSRILDEQACPTRLSASSRTFATFSAHFGPTTCLPAGTSLTTGKVAKYGHRTACPFSPPVLSVGGALECAAFKTLEGWRECLPNGAFSHFLIPLALNYLKPAPAQPSLMSPQPPQTRPAQLRSRPPTNPDLQIMCTAHPANQDSISAEASA